MNEPIRTQWQIRCAFNGFTLTRASAIIVLKTRIQAHSGLVAKDKTSNYGQIKANQNCVAGMFGVLPDCGNKPFRRRRHCFRRLRPCACRGAGSYRTSQEGKRRERRCADYLRRLRKDTQGLYRRGRQALPPRRKVFRHEKAEICNLGICPPKRVYRVQKVSHNCHPYSSYERGSNENENKMKRRHFPKGTDFGKVTAAEVKRAESWIANYPRKILGWKTSEMLFREAIAAL